MAILHANRPFCDLEGKVMTVDVDRGAVKMTYDLLLFRFELVERFLSVGLKSAVRIFIYDHR